MSPPEANDRGVMQRFWAALTMAVGALVATLCGGCALVFAVSFLAHPPPLSEWTFLFLPALLGGLPALAGVAILRAGLKLYRRADPDRDVGAKFD